MICEIAGCEEVASFKINGIGCACKACAKEVCEDLEINEEELVWL